MSLPPHKIRLSVHCLFLYRDVLRVELPFVEGIERARRPARAPVVFTRQEVDALVDFRSISLHSPEHGRVIDFETALAHHLFSISVGELIWAVPTDTQQDDVGSIKVRSDAS
jgi:hypothetical protein